MKKARVSGHYLKKLMHKHGLQGDKGADTIASILNSTRETVQGWYTKGIPNVCFELLVYKLSNDKATAEQIINEAK